MCWHKFEITFSELIADISFVIVFCGLDLTNGSKQFIFLWYVSNILWLMWKISHLWKWGSGKYLVLFLVTVKSYEIVKFETNFIPINTKIITGFWHCWILFWTQNCKNPELIQSDTWNNKFYKTTNFVYELKCKLTNNFLKHYFQFKEYSYFNFLLIYRFYFKNIVLLFLTCRKTIHCKRSKSKYIKKRFFNV